MIVRGGRMINVTPKGSEGRSWRTCPPRQWQRTKPPSTWDYLKFIQRRRQPLVFPLTLTHSSFSSSSVMSKHLHIAGYHFCRYLHSSWYSQTHTSLKTYHLLIFSNKVCTCGWCNLHLFSKRFFLEMIRQEAGDDYPSAILHPPKKKKFKLLHFTALHPVVPGCTGMKKVSESRFVP